MSRYKECHSGNPGTDGANGRFGKRRRVNCRYTRMHANEIMKICQYDGSECAEPEKQAGKAATSSLKQWGIAEWLLLRHGDTYLMRLRHKGNYRRSWMMGQWRCFAMRESSHKRSHNGSHRNR